MCVYSKLSKEEIDRDYDCFGDYDFDSTRLGVIDRCSYKEIEELEPVKDYSYLMQLNCRGLKSKMSVIEHLLNYDLKEMNIMAIMLIETWLKPGEEKFVKINGYNFVGQARPNRKGGGVGLLIRSDINHRIVSQKSEKEFECIIVKLKGPNKELIGATYRPPNTDPYKFIEYYDEMTSKYKNRNLTLGIDHNLDLIKSDRHEPTQTYLELNFDRGLTPTISKPTRVTKTSATLIDNIFCSVNMIDYYESHILLSDISDHFPCLLLRGGMDYEETRTIKRRNLNSKTIKRIKSDLECKNLSITNNTIDCEFNKFHTQLLDALNKHAPEREIVKRRNKVKSPWITRGLERSMKKCNKKYCTYLQDRTNHTKLNDYKTYRNNLKKVKRKARRDYYSKLCVELKNDSRKLWRVINNISKRCNDKSSMIEEIKSDKFMLTNGNAISNCFAKYFSEVGRNCFSKISKPKKIQIGT